MGNIKPILCKTEGPLSIYDCMNGAANFKDEQKKCQAYEPGNQVVVPTIER